MNHLDNLGRLLSPLLDDRNHVVGFTHLAKIARVPEARGRRDLSDAEEWLGGKVLTTQNRRLLLTEPGTELARLLGELDDLRSRVLAGSRTEVLAVDCEPALASLLARSFTDVFAAFRDAVRIEVQPFDAVTLRERLEAVPGAIGLGWCAEENATTVALGGKGRWVVLFPDGHAVPKREVAPADLAQLPRLFVAGEDERDPALAPVLAAVPAARRVTLPWAGAVLAAVLEGSGAGGRAGAPLGGAVRLSGRAARGGGGPPPGPVPSAESLSPYGSRLDPDRSPQATSGRTVRGAGSRGRRRRRAPGRSIFRLRLRLNSPDPYTPGASCTRLRATAGPVTPVRRGLSSGRPSSRHS